jgi:hypothetical protein
VTTADAIGQRCLPVQIYIYIYKRGVMLLNRFLPHLAASCVAEGSHNKYNLFVTRMGQGTQKKRSSGERFVGALLLALLFFALKAAPALSLFQVKTNKLKLSFFFFGATTPIRALAYLHGTLCYFSFLDIRQSVGLLGRVISSSQGLYLSRDSGGMQ